MRNHNLTDCADLIAIGLFILLIGSPPIAQSDLSGDWDVIVRVYKDYSGTIDPSAVIGLTHRVTTLHRTDTDADYLAAREAFGFERMRRDSLVLEQ